MPTAEETLAAELKGKNDAEKLAYFRSLGEKHGVKIDNETIVQLSDEQLSRIMEGDKSSVIEEATNKIERKYLMNAGESRARVEDAVSTKIIRQKMYRQDLEEAAKVFRAIGRHNKGIGSHSELVDAHNQQREYLQKSGRLVRATNDMTVGTAAEGGYTAPEVWETMVYDALARVSLARRFAYWFPMEHNVKRMPKLSTNVAGATVTELGTQNGSRTAFGQITWTLKKVQVITTPISVELAETADPDFIQLLTKYVMVEMSRKIDEVVFNTSDSGWTDLLDNTTNRVYLGNSSTSGKTDYSLTTFDDMNNLLYKLAEQYIPDDDVQGSDFITGEAQYWVNQALISTLLKLKGTTNQYIWGNVQDLQSGRKIFGKNVRRVLSFPSTTSAGQAFAAFGNLGYKWIGYRDGLLIDFLREGTVLDAAGASVSLAQASAYALRVNQLMDCQSIDESGLSRLWTAAS